MRQGDIYLVEMDPIRKGELGKTRPCVIISAEDYNRIAPTVLVMPVTSYAPTLRSPAIGATKMTGLDHASSVLPLHIRAVVKTRLGRLLGRAPREVLSQSVAILNTVIQID